MFGGGVLRFATEHYFPIVVGQTHLLSTLLSLIPKHKLYLELFSGSLTVFWNKHASTQEVVNDIDGRLINTLKVVKNYPDQLKKLLNMPSSRDLYYMYQEEMKTETDPVKRAAMYLYLITNTWSGISKEGSTFVPKMRNHLASKINQLDWFSNRLKDVCIENLDCLEAIKKYDTPDTFILADAPYRIVGDSLYEYFFTDNDHVRLSKAIREIKGKFLITYNNDKFIQLLYRKYPQMVKNTAKTMDRTHENPTEEHLIIANYDIVRGNFPHFNARYFEL
jgi:DNA adenine methylase